MAHRSILTPLTIQLVPLWLHSLPLQSSLSSSLLSLLSAPSSASSATTAAHGLGSASSARIYDCTAARVSSSSSFGGATNPGCWAAVKTSSPARIISKIISPTVWIRRLGTAPRSRPPPFHAVIPFSSSSSSCLVKLFQSRSLRELRSRPQI